MQIRVILVEILQCHVLLGSHCDNPRSHHIARLHIVQLHYVLDDLVLVGVDHAFLQSDVRHGGHLVPAHGRLVVISAQQTCNQLNDNDKRPHQHGQE